MFSNCIDKMQKTSFGTGPPTVKIRIKTTFKKSILREIDTLSREATLTNVLLPSKKEYSLEGKNLLPQGANYFLLENSF